MSSSNNPNNINNSNNNNNNNSNNNSPSIPQAARTKDEHVRSSEETDRRRLLHNSWQTSVHVPSIMERPSLEISNPASPPRGHNGQMTEWGGPSQALVPDQPGAVDMARVSSEDNRAPSRPAGYGRTTSNDYTVYERYEPATPSQQQPPGSSGPVDDGYFQRPYRRAPTAHSIREPETSSIKTSKYMPLGAHHQAKKSASFAPGHGQNEWQTTSESTPTKPPPPRRRGTSIYFVREGDDDGSGSVPPGDLFTLPFQSWMKGPIRNSFVAWLGEFVGTTLFLWFAFAGTLVANLGSENKQQSTTGDTAESDLANFDPMVNMYVSISFGFSLMVNVWIFFRVSGGLFNPAVTLGMVMTKTIDYIRGLLLVSAQLTGAILASFLVQVQFPYTYNVRTTLSPSTSIVQGVFIEIILTAQLVFTVFMLAKEKHKATYMAPVGIGLALFIAELVGVFFTGGSLNPARSFGPCVTTGKFDGEHWIYWVGPALGAILAVAFYNFIKALEYEMANPGQDLSSEKAAAEAAGNAKRNAMGEKDLA